MDGPITLRVEGDAPVRADKFLFESLSKIDGYATLTRSKIKGYIAEGLVKLDGRTVAKAGTMVKPGVTLVLEVPDLEPSALEPMDGVDLPILYTDDHIIVLNKPAGMAVHPGAGNRTETLVNALLAQYGVNGLAPASHDRPGVVHRLDQDTTGVMVIARTEVARLGLSEQFHDHTVMRRYHALVCSTPRGTRQVSTAETGTIDAPIGRHRFQRTLMSVRRDNGKSAVTHWKRLEIMAYACLLELTLETGRTHQIRVHMNHIGSPVLGDRTYGDFSFIPPELQKAALTLGRQALHASVLGFTHPATGERLEFKTELPPDMMGLIGTFREFS